MKSLGKICACAFIVFFCYYISYAHSEAEHSRDIGMVFGLCDVSGNSLKSNSLHKDIGRVIAELIDKQADELHQKLNDIIRDELKTDVFFTVLPATFEDRNKKFLEELDKNFKFLKRKNSYKDLHDVAEHLNWISNKMRDLPFYVNSDIEKISNTVYQKRNKFTRKSNIHEMKDFLLVSNRQIADIIRSYKGFQPQQFKAQLDTFARDKRFFRWGGYGHRIFFHWGYNKNFETSYRPLLFRIGITKDFIKTLSPKYESKVVQIERKLYDEIKRYWNGKKKTAITNLKRHLLQVSNQTIDDDTAEVILQLAYNVHILGDYSDTVIEPLASIQDIRSELIECINKFDVDDRPKRRKVIDRINAAANKYGNYDAKNAAELLKTLKYDIPILLMSSSKYRLQLMGE